jgi:hypothetical protein
VIDGAGWHRSDALKAPDNIYLWNFVEFTVNFPYAIAKSNFPQ